MMRDFIANLGKRDAVRKWLNVFLGVQLAIAAVKILESYRYNLNLFHKIAWYGLAEASTWSTLIFNVLLVLLSFWASPLQKRKRYSVLEAGCYGYLLFISLLALLNYGCMYATRHFYPLLNDVYLFALFLAGFRNYSAMKERLAEMQNRGTRERRRGSAPYGWIVAIIGLTMAPFLILPYFSYDAVNVYALKAFAIKATGSAGAVCLGDGSFYPPLYPIILSLGMGDHLFQGKLIPFFMLLSFVAIFRHALPAKGFIDRTFAVALLLSTPIVWLCAVANIANVPFMTLLGAGGLLLVKSRSFPGDERTGSEAMISTILLGAATLIREDGAIIILAMLLGIFMLDKKRHFFRYIAAATIVLALSLSWEFRPFWLRAAAGYLQKQDAARAAALGYGFHFKTVINFLYAAQGLYLSHYGFGTFFYGLIIAFIAGMRRKTAFTNTALLYGCITAVCLCAVAAEYLCLGLFLTNGMKYYVQVQLSYARSTMHFLPFMVLFFVALVNGCFTGAAAGTLPENESPSS